MAPKARRVVVKIGTNTISGPDGTPDAAFLAGIADDIVSWKRRGHEFLLVTSGAIGTGRAILGLKERPREVELRQACAAVGQARLMRAWEEAFAPHGVPVAQLLLTAQTFNDRTSFLNLRNATESLLSLGVVPIANENDTVSIEEIGATFGDNDRLSALVATKVRAELLVILSDVAGLYTAPPGEPGATLVPAVERLTPEILRMAGVRAGSGGGRGGMRSKLDAVRISTAAGIPVVVAHGREPSVVSRILSGEPLGTRFFAEASTSGREAWLRIAYPQGRIHVDRGAADALRAGRHLLPAGVTGIDGTFPRGAVVEILHDGRPVAKALSSYAARELDAVKGLRSDDARKKVRRDGAMNVTRKYFVVLLK
ncbi:MAG: glutamate 5-kinase [Methanobacteriota archaeon]